MALEILSKNLAKNTPKEACVKVGKASLPWGQLHTISTTNTHASTWISPMSFVVTTFSICLVSAFTLGTSAICGSRPPEKQIIFICSSHCEAISAENHLKKKRIPELVSLWDTFNK